MSDDAEPSKVTGSNSAHAEDSAQVVIVSHAGYDDARQHLEELTGEYNEAAAQYFTARDHLYDGIRQIAGEDLMPKLHISRITGISRPTIDKICSQEEET